ncbi:hypothetical protein [Lacibacter sp. H407]|uniref:hypothetical protein n=1 Tax=Lacibacter sp. H407 TaxID=3133423 RepID=UPI0030BD9308
MQLPVYIGYDKFRQVGYVTITSDRITNVDISFSFPTPMGHAERFALYVMQGKEQPQTTLELKQDTQFSFAIKKISRADFAYRNSSLTHELISNDLKKYFDNTKFFTKPSFAQKLTLSYSLKKFFWQTQDFKTHIYKYVATSFISLAIGIIGTLILIKPCDNTKGSDKPNITTPPTDTLGKQLVTPITGDTLTHQPIHKTKTP